MDNSNSLFKLMLSSSVGDEKAKWELVRQYEDYISSIAKNDEDLKQIMILDIYEKIPKISENFIEFFKNIKK